MTPTHVYADNGIYTATLTVTDNNGGVGTDTLTVTVNNVAPIVDAGSGQTANEGDIISLAPSTFSDKGTSDSHTAAINWGDGTAMEAGTVAESGGSGTVSGSHSYAKYGIYTVEVCVTDDDGASSCDTFALTVKDITPPVITINGDNPSTVVLGTPYEDDGATATDNSDGTVTVTTTGIVNTASVGTYPVTYTATDSSSNTATASRTANVIYAPAGSMCLDAPGHEILQPINKDGSSVFKKGSTVPAKFRVCDANGNSIGTTGVVSSFKLIQKILGTVVNTVNEDVISTTPDTAFRWDSTAQQWIFNINTKNLLASYT